MTTKKLNAKFAALTYASSKMEEIEAITEIFKNVPEQTFLASLFTKEFINWVLWQIQNDESPDIFQKLQFVEASQREQISQLQAENVRLQNAVENLEKRLEFAKQCGEDKINQLKQAEDFIQNVTDENSQRRIENATLKNEILILKAMLFDAGISKK